MGQQRDMSPSAGGEHLTSGLSLQLSMPLCFSNLLLGVPRSLHGQWVGEARLRKWADVVESKCPCIVTLHTIYVDTCSHGSGIGRTSRDYWTLELGIINTQEVRASRKSTNKEWVSKQRIL